MIHLIVINGCPADNAEKMTLSDYLAGEGYIPARIAIEYNGKIISREEYGQIRLQDGDSVEIIQFMGGGSCPLSTRTFLPYGKYGFKTAFMPERSGRHMQRRIEDGK